MKNLATRLLLSGLVVCLALTPMPVLGQEAGADESEEEADEFGEEITVTARKREETVQEVPFSLVAQTDAFVVVTNYHDPSADNPQGVDGCREQCFAEATEEAVATIAEAIDRIAERHPGRVAVADVASSFDGHGAGNGRGPDVSRLGRGPLSRFLPAPVRGVSSYCAKGDHSNDTWINALDCVHPNGEGQEAYADAVLAAIDRAGWRPTG